MREKLYDSLEKLGKRELALIAAGDQDSIRELQLPPELDDFVSQNPDIVSIVAIEILAKNKGFKVEDTDIIKLKKDGEIIGEFTVYRYGDDKYVLLEDTIYKLNRIDKLETLKKPQIGKQVEQPPQTPRRPRANI
jgi:hypothetical protein